MYVYSGCSDETIIKKLKDCDSVVYCGYLSGSEYEDIFLQSDALLFVESFDVVSIDRVKHSMSTKIADCLASGICLLAYGPAELSSIHHLKENDAAFVASSKAELVQALNDLLKNNKKRAEIISNALLTAEKYHNSKKNSELLKQTLQKTLYK